MLKDYSKIAGYQEAIEQANDWQAKVWAVTNELGFVCLTYGDNEQEALDNAVDSDLMDSFLMSPEDHEEYESNGWDDSYIYLGNASQPFWSEYMGLQQLSTD